MWKWKLWISEKKVDLTKSALKHQEKSFEKTIFKIQARQKRHTAVLAFSRANNMKELEQASQEIQSKDEAHNKEISMMRKELEECTSSYSQQLSDSQSVHARVLKVVTFRIWASFSTRIARFKRLRSIAVEKHIINVEAIGMMRTQLTVFMIWSRWKNLLYKKTRRMLDTADLKLAGKLSTPIHKLFTGFLNDCHDRKVCIQSTSQLLTPSSSNDGL